MGWVDARRVIAAVAHQKIRRNLFRVTQLPRQTVRLEAFLAVIENAVALPGERSAPRPTHDIASGFGPRPKTTQERLADPGAWPPLRVHFATRNAPAILAAI